MERSGVELGQDINLIETRIDTVRDRDIDDTVFPPERDCGFGTFFGERIKARALSASEDD